MIAKKPKAILCVDYANLHYGIDRLGWDIDYLKPRRYFEQDYDIISAYYYVGIHSYKSYFDTNRQLNRLSIKGVLKFFKDYKAKADVFKSLSRKGYIVKSKDIASVWDKTIRKYKLKCNLDVEITLDALDRINDYGVFVLISGDSDFVALLEYLKSKGKKVIIMGVKGRFAFKLRQSGDNKRKYLDKLRSTIEYIKPKTL